MIQNFDFAISTLSHPSHLISSHLSFCILSFSLPAKEKRKAMNGKENTPNDFDFFFHDNLKLQILRAFCLRFRNFSNVFIFFYLLWFQLCFYACFFCIPKAISDLRCCASIFFFLSLSLSLSLTLSDSSNLNTFL